MSFIFWWLYIITVLVNMFYLTLEFYNWWFILLTHAARMYHLYFLKMTLKGWNVLKLCIVLIKWWFYMSAFLGVYLICVNFLFMHSRLCSTLPPVPMGTGSLSPGVKWPGRGVHHPPPSSTKITRRVELLPYSPSGPSWPVLGWPLHFCLYIYAVKIMD